MKDLLDKMTPEQVAELKAEIFKKEAAAQEEAAEEIKETEAAETDE